MSEDKSVSLQSELAAINRAGNMLGLETRLRASQVVAVPVIDNTRNLKTGREYFGAPGTITVILGRTPASVGRVREAVGAGGQPVTEVVNEIQQVGQEAQLTLEEAFNKIATAPVFATLVYGGTELVENLFIPEGRDLVGFTLPYNGGRLAATGFELRQYYRPGATLYEGVALQTIPELTPAEKAALEQVPDPDLWRNVGALPDCSALCFGAAVLVQAQAR